jgi:1-acyl-sn-glycerol-3-phosphate acyltransferase
MIGNLFYALARAVVWTYFRIRYRLRIHNRHNIPKLRGNFIVACNHQSYADPPAIAAVINRRFAFMAKQELFQGNPLFALLIRALGAFPVVRGAKDSAAIDISVEKLKKGRILVIFPEGTRSKDGQIGKAKSGVALIAAMAGAPILPVCIVYGRDKKRDLDFALGEMLEPAQISPENRKELREFATGITNTIKGLQEQINGGKKP